MTRRTAEEWHQWLADFSRGENAEAWRGIMCFLRWIQIRAENGHPIPNFLPAMEGDIFHSHLLRRMLAGKDPLEAPPPESFGQPWYDLVETGRGTRDRGQAVGVGARSRRSPINQGIWTILEKKSDSEYLVTYRLNPEAYRLTPQGDGNWLLDRVERTVVGLASATGVSSAVTNVVRLFGCYTISHICARLASPELRMLHS